MAKHDIGNYVKFQDWEQLRKGNAIDLYSFNDKEELVCLNGKTATRCSEYNGRHPKQHGYLYVIENCKRCRYQKVCKVGVKDKKAIFRCFDVSYEFWKGKTVARENLLTGKGIEMRVNRSSQVEGVFGIVKQDMQYDRFRRRGLDKVHVEMCLTLVGHLLRKLFAFYDGRAKFDYWIAPPDLSDEMMPEVDGWDVCRTIRRKSDIPIILLTARSQEFDQLNGFEAGCDEYVTKPFSPSVLVKRIEALLKRYDSSHTSSNDAFSLLFI